MIFFPSDNLPLMPPSLCSFFGFYDANETVLEMEKQLVSLLELLSLSAHTVVLSALDMEAEGSTLWGGGSGMQAGTYFVSPCVFLPCPLTHLEGLSAGLFWVEDSLSGAIVRCVQWLGSPTRPGTPTVPFMRPALNLGSPEGPSGTPLPETEWSLGCQALVCL